MINACLSNRTDPVALQYIFLDGSGSFQFQPRHGYPSGCEFVLYKDDPVTKAEILAFVAAYVQSHSHIQKDTALSQQSHAAIAKLQKLGVDVYNVDPQEMATHLSWDALAGYAHVKQEINDTVILALQNPALYEAIAKRTRCRFESNRPRAVLFEGPPGTGKTLSARIIAQHAGVPLIHLPVESVVSKWYGDSEKKLSAIFDACEELSGAILFIDEVMILAIYVICCMLLD
jgi:ATP-dependent 26S proteasome regulatory subunit